MTTTYVYMMMRNVPTIVRDPRRRRCYSCSAAAGRRGHLHSLPRLPQSGQARELIEAVTFTLSTYVVNHPLAFPSGVPELHAHHSSVPARLAAQP